MKRIARIPYEHMEWVWISAFWDVPLRGLCKYNNKLYSFQGFGAVCGKKMARYHILKMNLLEKIRWLLRKFTFEIMVGKHWSSYPSRIKYKDKGFLRKIYYLPFNIKWRLRSIKCRI